MMDKAQDAEPSTESLATQRAEALVGSLNLAHQANARDRLHEILEWTAKRRRFLVLDTAEREQPHVRFNLSDGRAFWIARGTVGGDAKVELLTRTGPVRFSDPVFLHICELLGDLLTARQPGDGQVIQVPLASLKASHARSALRETMDFALGAAAAEVTLDP